MLPRDDSAAQSNPPSMNEILIRLRSPLSRAYLFLDFTPCDVSAMRDSCCHLSSAFPYGVSRFLFFIAFNIFNPPTCGLVSERELVILVSSFVTKPPWLHRFLLPIFLTRAEMVIYTWIKQLVWGVISWNMCACWRFVIWTIGIITLPFRALSALHREKMTAKHFEELQFEIENLLWNHKRLEGQFALAIKERKVLESMLAELEEEHDKAIVKIEHLEKQVYNLKTENLELRATQGKRAWDFKSKDDIKEAQTKTPSSSLTELLSTTTPRKRSSTKGTRKDSLQKETENEVRLNATDLVYHEEDIYQRRDVALSQSVFSALLSLLVGSVVYEAKDPCMPLVLALFVVVGMSLKSVIYFLSTIKNKPASDAITLLSFNWFILGTLTYPTLPVAARFLSALVLSCISWTLGLFGFGSSA